MPHPATQKPIVWINFGEDGFDAIYLNFPWIITSNNETFTVKINYIKWTFNYENRIQVKIHPRGNPSKSQQLDIDESQPFFKSLADALLEY